MKNKSFTRILTILLAVACVLSLVPAALAEEAGNAVASALDPVPGYEIGISTKASGNKQIWVLKEYSDVKNEHWFSEALKGWRKSGILVGDADQSARLDESITAAEIYTLLVRYIYSDTFEGEEIGGAIKGDYTYNSHAAWMDAYDEVQKKLEDTIRLIDADIQLPNGRSEVITRKQAFILYAMAELSRVKDPAWYLSQFSSTHLGYYARSNAPIETFDKGLSTLSYFATADHYQLSALEIQCANMLMYLGVLNGTNLSELGRSLAPNKIISRAEGVKLLEGVDLVASTPHANETRDTTKTPASGDWGGNGGDHPAPPDIPVLPHEPVSVILVDWDNEVIGAMSATTNTDLRKQVSDYCLERLVHPDLTNADVNSLAREDNYRGKYSQTPIKNEERISYPLTSHLDYCFVQRPFIPGNEKDQYIQQYGDGLYPYAYGWALCEYDKYENTWTTLGVGEMSSWNGRSFIWEKGQGSWDFTLADLEKGIPTGMPKDTVVLKAMYQPGPDLVTGEEAMYRITELTTFFMNGGFGGRSANLSPSEWRDYRAENSEISIDGTITQQVVQGETGDTANLFGSSQGVAQSDDWKASLNNAMLNSWVVYERSTEIDGKVYGVERGRQLSVATWGLTDKHWLSAVSEVVPDMDNETHAELIEGKAMWDTPVEYSSSSVKVGHWTPTSTGKTINEFVNQDIIEVELPTNGNFNKVNFQLVDKYNANAFIGKAKSMDNEWYRQNRPNLWLKDNFNYKEADSNLSDDRHDVHPLDATGADGRLMDAFLTSLAIMGVKATTDQDFKKTETSRQYDWISRFVLFGDGNPFNLRDCNGDLVTRLNFLGAGGTIKLPIPSGDNPMYALELGVEDIILNHYRETGWWNFEQDIPILTYHQIQLWYNACEKYWPQKGQSEGSRPHMLSPAEADAVDIPWCNLHEHCAKHQEGMPRTWDELIDRAKAGEADKIAMLSLNELERATHLRKTIEGERFASKEECINALIPVVQSGITDWPDIQNALLGGEGTIDDYAWFAGDDANSPRMASYRDLANAIVASTTPRLYPDGKERESKAGLGFDVAEKIFYGENYTTPWGKFSEGMVRGASESTAENGMITVKTEDWPSFEEFLSDYTAVITELRRYGFTFEGQGSDKTGHPSWEIIQKLILTSKYNPFEEDVPDNERSSRMCWKNKTANNQTAKTIVVGYKDGKWTKEVTSWHPKHAR